MRYNYLFNMFFVHKLKLIILICCILVIILATKSRIARLIGTKISITISIVSTNEALLASIVGREGDVVVPQLAAVLRSDNPIHRQMVASVLDRLKPAEPHAIKLLLQCLDDPDSRVRLAALETLARMGPSASRAGPRILGFLDDQNVVIRLQAIQCVGNMRLMNAKPNLIEMRDSDSDADVRVRAAWALGELR